MGGLKKKLPSMGGGGVWIFSRTTPFQPERCGSWKLVKRNFLFKPSKVITIRAPYATKCGLAIIINCQNLPIFCKECEETSEENLHADIRMSRVSQI